MKNYILTPFSQNTTFKKYIRETDFLYQIEAKYHFYSVNLKRCTYLIFIIF